jgi:hypothetical protein
METQLCHVVNPFSVSARPKQGLLQLSSNAQIRMGTEIKRGMELG